MLTIRWTVCARRPFACIWSWQDRQKCHRKFCETWQKLNTPFMRNLFANFQHIYPMYTSDNINKCHNISQTCKCRGVWKKTNSSRKECAMNFDSLWRLYDIEFSHLPHHALVHSHHARLPVACVKRFNWQLALYYGWCQQFTVCHLKWMILHNARGYDGAQKRK